MTQNRKRRYAVVGTGGRVPMFIDPLVRDFSEYAELVGLCDISLTRVNYHRERLQKQYGYHEVPAYTADDFRKMVEETQPDVIIVCTMDSLHAKYIVESMELGCDVVTEKPITVNAESCRAILDAAERTGRHCRVAFNYRWSPGVSKVRELIANGTIGDVKHVNLEYQLNTSHGADYFRRWHSSKESSGGLLVHKSTHHFDLVNWWIDAIPQQVFAFGDLKFYGKENALARGDEAYTAYERYTGAEEAKADPFAFNLDKGSLKGLYLDAEAESGYLRDRNVFREGINIEDTMSVLVKYRTGVVLTYSLVAYSPLEGYKVSFTGDRGRIEYTEMHESHIIAGQSDVELGKQQQKKGGGHDMHLRVIPHFQEGYEVPIEVAEGGHGGGDPLLQAQIFHPEPTPDTLRRSAGQEQGVASALIGIAANASIVSGVPEQIESLCPLKPGAKHMTELV